MRFYNQQHQFTGGVDLHVRSIYLHILDDDKHRLADLCEDELIPFTLGHALYMSGPISREAAPAAHA